MTSRAAAVDRSQSVGHQPYPIDHADEFDERLGRALENPRLRDEPDRVPARMACGSRSRRGRDRFSDAAIADETSQIRGHRELGAVSRASFALAAEAAGATVHIASDAEAANRIILEIARRHDVSLIAKSKSMVSEEIGFNHVAEDAGFRVRGDRSWRVDRPAPPRATEPHGHARRAPVSAGNRQRHVDGVGRDVSGEDIAAQVGTARDEIRDAFFAAGMGITGANALIAESGTVMMVTNEGNGRLCASVPPVHVVLAGIEKLIPTFDDAVTQLRLLARSGTAQRITSLHDVHHRSDPGSRDAHRSGRQRAANHGVDARVSSKRCTASAVRPAPMSVHRIGRSAVTPSATSTPARLVWS